MPSPFLSLVRCHVLFVGGTGMLMMLTPSESRAEDWQGLFANSPFGQAPTAPAKTNQGDVEFRGVVEEEGTFFVNLYNPTTKTSQWVPVKGQVADLEVKAYDIAAEKVEITQAGRSLTLPLKQAKVTLAKAEPGLAPTMENPEGREQNAERRAELRQKMVERLEARGDPEQVLRKLPPEAQAMMEEFRRRRAERAERGDTPDAASPKTKSRPASTPTQRTRRQP